MSNTKNIYEKLARCHSASEVERMLKGNGASVRPDTDLEYGVRLAIRDEREQCALLCEGAAEQLPPIAPAAQQARLIAKWIRQRSDK